MEQVDSANPIERFQQIQTLVTSKDTEAEGLTLAIKKANPNTGGPSSSSGPKMQEEVALKKTKKKSKNKKDTDEGKSETTERQSATAKKTDRDTQLSTTPRKQQKLKKVDMSFNYEDKDIEDTFQNRKLAPAEWEIMANQVLKSGVQKVADELRGKNLSVGERDKNSALQRGHQMTPAWKKQELEEADVKLSAKNHNALRI